MKVLLAVKIFADVSANIKLADFFAASLTGRLALPYNFRVILT